MGRWIFCRTVRDGVQGAVSNLGSVCWPKLRNATHAQLHTEPRTKRNGTLSFIVMEQRGSKRQHTTESMLNKQAQANCRALLRKVGTQGASKGLFNNPAETPTSRFISTGYWSFVTVLFVHPHLPCQHGQRRLLRGSVLAVPTESVSEQERQRSKQHRSAPHPSAAAVFCRRS